MFERHFGSKDLEKIFSSDFRFPEDFLFGVANAAYQVEGGFNGPGEPLNSWVTWERSGRVDPSGEAIRFWTDYEEQIERAKNMGLSCFRFGIEWARVQPDSHSSPGNIPPFDMSAIETYSDIAASIMKAGMEPVITLHHFTHPYWLGLDFWLEDEKLGLFEDYVRKIVYELNRFLIEKHSLHPVKYWITINEPNGLAWTSYLFGVFPHGKLKLGISNSFKAWNNLIIGHSKAYDAIHELYEENGWQNPSVTYNVVCQATYETDKIMTDLVLARQNGVHRNDISTYLQESRKKWNEEIEACPLAQGESPLSRRLDLTLSDLLSKVIIPERFGRLLDKIYSSPLEKKLDYIAIDVYDIFLSHEVKAPSLEDIREGRFNLNAEHWEWVINPPTLYHSLKAQAINTNGLPVMVAENGMSFKVYRGRVAERRDGATRDVFLESYLYEVARALKDGVPVIGYIHWTLVDNYEWGSYDPRFGIFTVDRSKSPVKILDRDAWGIDAAKAYKELASAMRSNDLEKIKSAFLRSYQ